MVFAARRRKDWIIVLSARFLLKAVYAVHKDENCPQLHSMSQIGFGKVG